jgi:hypothetical protein
MALKKKRVENTRIYIKCYPSDLYLLFVAPKNKKKGGKIIFFFIYYIIYYIIYLRGEIARM